MALLSALAACLLAEVGLRLAAHRRNQEVLARASSSAVVPPPGTSLHLGEILQLSPNDRLVYELSPGLQGVRFEGRELTTNHLGLRGPELSIAKPEGTLRLLGIGDSVLFGWGVELEESYLARLGRRLEESHPQVRWEVINAGVPGYNTVMEVEALERKGLALDPDVVVLGFVGNDLQLPNFIRAEEPVLSLARSFLLDHLLRERRPHARSGLQSAPRPSEQGRELAGFESDPARVPARYRELAGAEAALAAVGRLAELSAEHGFLVVVVVHHHDPAEDLSQDLATVHALARQHGFLVADVRGELARFLGGRPYEPADFVLRPDDLHPSPRHHELVAEALHRTLLNSSAFGSLVR